MDTYQNKDENNNINPYDDGINLVDFFSFFGKENS